MTMIDMISDRLKTVLKDLEKVTNDIETIQTQASAVANDDFDVCNLNKPLDV